jgi:hypothetical protein
MIMDYPEIVERVNTFHEVLKTTESRDKIYTPEEKAELKETIMAMDNETYAAFKKEYHHTKNMNSLEYQDYQDSKADPVEEKVFYDGRRNTLKDFNLDQTSLNILTSPTPVVNKKIDIYKDDKPSNLNLKI